MKYVLLFCAEREDVPRFEAMTDEQQSRQFAAVSAWFARNGSKIKGGSQLADPSTATTVRFSGDGDPLVTDGPFLESKEVIGGFVEVEVADLDEALALAGSWPPKGTVEVRPVLEMHGAAAHP